MICINIFNSSIYSAVIITTSALFFASPPFIQANASTEVAPAKDAVENGAFEKVQEPLSKLVNLGITNTRLTINKCNWPNVEDVVKDRAKFTSMVAIGPFAGRTVYTVKLTSPETFLFGEILDKAQGQRLIESANPDKVDKEFESDTLIGKLSIPNDGMSITLTETKGQKRSLYFSCNNHGQMKIIIGQHKNNLLTIEQSADGKVVIKLAANAEKKTDVLALTGDSYAKLHFDNYSVMEKRVFPILREYGVGVEISIESALLKNTSISMVVLVDQDDDNKAKNLIIDLDADEYETRKSAYSELNKDYLRYKKVILTTAEKSGNSEELTAKLKSLIEIHHDDNTSTIVESLKLLEIPEFLLQLIEQANETQKKHIFIRLEKITGQKLGTDVEAWEKWLKESATTSSTNK